MKLFLFSILLFFASMGSSYNSLYASDVVVEADFELAESVEIQNSFLEPSSVFASAEAVAVAIDRASASGSMSEDLDLSVSVWDRIVSRLDSFFSFLRSSDHLSKGLMEFPQISGSALVARDDRSFALELDRIFLDSLQNASFVSDSIFAIVSSDFADSLKEVSLSNSANRSSLFAGFVVLDLFLPERTRKKLVPSIFRTSPLLSALFSSFLGNRLGIVSGPVLIFTHLSFHHSFLNRKLLRYYAIRSDGPPYLSFQQVCV
ncbi:hypothetical protein AB3N59_02505 [Leptospira sp. WS92.C1]